MSECKSCGRDMEVQATHWEGCHTSHPDCAAFKAGREAGMREASDICVEKSKHWQRMTPNIISPVACAAVDCSDAILSAIEGAK